MRHSEIVDSSLEKNLIDVVMTQDLFRLHHREESKFHHAPKSGCKKDADVKTGSFKIASSEKVKFFFLFLNR